MSDAEKMELRPANDNPWYCLATMYGEQLSQGKLDCDLAAKNRAAWNRWIAGPLGDEARADLVKNGLSESEIIPFTAAEKSAFFSAFAARAGREGELPPNPAGPIDFARTHFDSSVSM